jgi:hypothetical protein
MPIEVEKAEKRCGELGVWIVKFLERNRGYAYSIDEIMEALGFEFKLLPVYFRDERIPQPEAAPIIIREIISMLRVMFVLDCLVREGKIKEIYAEGKKHYYVE